MFERCREENCEGRRATEKECVRVREKGSERCMNDVKVEKGERVRERTRAVSEHELNLKGRER